MEWGQLLCIFCLLELAGCTAGSTTATPGPTGGDSSRGTAGDSAATTASAATGDTSSTKPTPAAAPASSGATTASPELLGQLISSPQPSPAPTPLPGSSPGPQGSPGVPTSRSPPSQPGHRAPTAGTAGPAATSAHPAGPAATTGLPTATAGPQPAISCHGAADNGDAAGAICLQLNESSTCEHFLERKGSDLWQALCENRTHSVESPCEIQLTPSSLDRDCLLLILKGEKDPVKLRNTLQESHWEKLGIESLKESPRGRRDAPRRTLIALVTSGLLLALLGLAGCLLVRRRSWSPAGQRLAEDPYDTENGSQGNTMLMSPCQEPAEPQEKPNLPRVNGGSPEKGAGPAASQNGHSGRQHRPADTEM